MAHTVAHDPKQHPTRKTTLYRLRGMEGTERPSEDVFDRSMLKKYALTVVPTDIGGMPAVVAYGIFSTEDGEEPEWHSDAERVTGLTLPSLKQIKSGVAVAVAVDGAVYAFGFGGPGNRLIRSELKDPGFGVGFAIRATDANEIHYMARKAVDIPGRQDQTLVAGGLRISAYGIRKYGEVVRRIGARANQCDLTFQRNRRRATQIQCGEGIHLSLGVTEEDLVRDIREIARVGAEDPHPDLAFIEEFREVRDPDTLDVLELYLEDALSGDEEHDVLLVPPANNWEDYFEAQAVSFDVGGVQGAACSDPEPEDLLRSFEFPQGEFGRLLREGSVHLHNGSDVDPVKFPNPLRWLEVTVRLGWAHYVLSEDRWFEIGAHYTRVLHEEIKSLIPEFPSVHMPSWPKDKYEKDYVVQDVAAVPGFVPLDRALVPTSRHQGGRGRGFEVCDVLGPENELIHVKRGKSGGVLSYLFAQGNVAVESLRQEKEVAEGLRKKVSEVRPGRNIPEGFCPEKVIYAIQLNGNGKDKALKAENLTPFTQAALYQAALYLKRQRITVEVVGIPHGD